MNVLLRVYKIGPPEAVLMLNNLLKKNFQGIWHTSIEVYGKEIYYADEILKAIPGSTIHNIPHITHDLGETEIPEEVFDLFLANLEGKFGRQTYDLLLNNCNHFTNTCTQFLVDKQIPEYIMEVHESALENEIVSNMIRMFFKGPERSRE